LNYCSNVCGELNKRFEYGGEYYRYRFQGFAAEVGGIEWKGVV